MIKIIDNWYTDLKQGEQLEIIEHMKQYGAYRAKHSDGRICWVGEDHCEVIQ